MISTKDTKYMLREAKSRAKQKEFKIEIDNYPHYITDFRDLDYSSVYALSKYAEAIIENNSEDIKEYYNDLKIVSQYFDAATSIVRERDYTTDYLLSGACAYFLSDDFGSAKALLNHLKGKQIEGIAQKLTIAVLQGVFNRYDKDNVRFNDALADAFYAHFLQFLDSGSDINDLYVKWGYLRNNLFEQSDIFGVYYINILFAIIKQIEENISWKLLPNFSSIKREKWLPYLEDKRSVKILWAAQRIIGEAGIFAGKSGIIQLPTGVGKTKSLELIIRSAFIANRTNAVIIITPLRALCGEIKTELQFAFDRTVTVNQFSDALQEDFTFEFNEDEKSIIVCTPEKLKYILHHNKDFLNQIGLFIFDEGHMFDYPTRGAAYELLVTTIKSIINVSSQDHQCIFISAVMSNAEQIGNWLFNNQGVIATSNKIKTTEKNIGFVSYQQNSVEYYADGDFSNINYWVPKVLKPAVNLVTKSGNKTNKLFPENSAKDISIYLMNLLNDGGAVAIYISRPDWISGYIKRIIEVIQGGVDLSQLTFKLDPNEMIKLKKLIEIHYGKESEYAIGVKLGVVPHYSDLEEGVKLSIEYALRNELIGNVICTSTLSQGVNIPIKYLLLTGFDSYQRDMRARELQNLVGRTARAGMYSEGSVIVTDTRLYSERLNSSGYRYRTGGKYNWEKKTSLFNPQNSEPCGSAIKAIIEPIFIHKDYEPVCFKDDILDALESGEDGINKLHQALIQQCQGFSENYNKRAIIISNINKYFNLVKNVLDSIESHISFLFSIDIAEQSVEEISDTLCVTTLAYDLANEEEKKYLIKLFRTIAQNVLVNTKLINPIFQAKAMAGINKSVAISKWISDNISVIEGKDDFELAECILPLYKNLTENKFAYSDTAILLIVRQWIEGVPLNIIYNRVKNILPARQNLISLEKFCRAELAYTFSFLVGNIIDLSADISELTKINLQNFQKRLKYGLKTLTAISLYEEGISDRHIAERLAEVLGNENIGEKDIVEVLKINKEEVLHILLEYPTYFTKEFKRICG